MTAVPATLDILFVGLLPPHPGGAPLSCVQLLSGLAREGHAVRALSPIRADGRELGEALAMRHPEVSIARYTMEYDSVNPLYPAPEAYRVLERQKLREEMPRLIAQRRPDVIVLGRETFLLDAPGIAREFAIPSVLMVRGGTTLGLLRGHYPTPLADRFWAEFKRVDCIVAVARHFASSLHGVGLSDVRVIPNAVDCDAFRPGPAGLDFRDDLNIPETSRVVLFVGLLKSIKRPFDFVDAAARMPQDLDLIYVVAGDGPLKTEMKERCRRIGILERFRFIGWIDNTRIKDYYNLADIVVMTSEGEGFSRVYLETFACGRLLVASDIDAAREFVEDGKTGLLFRTGDVDDLARAIGRAASDCELREAIGHRAREHARAFAPENMVRSYVTILTEVVGRASGARSPQCPE